MSPWMYRMSKPFVSGGKTAFLEARALSRLGLKAQRAAGVFSSGDPRRAQVALTFNDGPHPDVTPMILDVLESFSCRGTFFLIGREVIEHNRLAHEIVRRGHELGNHTMNHVKCAEESERECLRQIQNAQDTIRISTGVEAKWFRPPFGNLDEMQLHIPAQSGLKTVFWTKKIKDWECDDARALVREMSRQYVPGAIFALHEKLTAVPQALEAMLKEIHKRNLQPVTLSELFARDPLKAKREG